MNNRFCSACKNTLAELGKIPDGILFKCNYCGSKKIYIENYQNLKNEIGYGDAYSERFDERKTKHLIKLFENVLPDIEEEAELLDIGFGTGEFLYSMNKRGISVTGLECDPVSVKKIRNKGIETITGELGGLLSVVKKFKLVTLWDVIEHINNIELAFEQLKNLTSRHGRVFIVTPNSESLLDYAASAERNLTFRKSQRIMNICLNRYHLHRFSLKGLNILFERFGFSIEKTELIHLFSLKPEEYTDGFAPGILRWTDNTSFNKFFSGVAMLALKTFNVRNKIFLVAKKN